MITKLVEDVKMNQTQVKLQNIVVVTVDVICAIFSYYIAGVIWLGLIKGIHLTDMISLMNYNFIYILTAILLAAGLCLDGVNYVERKNFAELLSVLRKTIIIAGTTAICILMRKNNTFPRGVYVLMIIFYILFSILSRLIVKTYLLQIRRFRKTTSKMIMITTKDRAYSCLKMLGNDKHWLCRITGLVITDQNMVGQKIEKLPVVADMQGLLQYVKNAVVDEVFIDEPMMQSEHIRAIILKLEDMGITTHLKIAQMEQLHDFDTSLQYLGEVPVITFANRFYNVKDLIFKRLFDIIGALIGLMITAVVTIFVAPAIKLESKGPIFFSQTRVGRNGRYFKIYKFRSMYLDAEKRKEDLLDNNEMNGLMFKMSDDPRITKVGKFLRRTSIDELPQFYNVLLGDMSLIGTRPPTVNEFKKYKGHHMRRLSMKPGITGMWQAYGRQSVNDFEDVVKMDLNYIDHFCFSMDVKILLRTVVALFQGQ